MSVKLNVGGTVFEFPSSGENPNWATTVVEWATAVTDVLALLSGPNDILPQTFLLPDNQTVPLLVKGLSFNPAQVRAANVSYAVYRTTDQESRIETGDILLTYDSNAPLNQKWQASFRTNGNTNTILTIDDSGQFYVTTDDMLDPNNTYNGVIKFSAKALTS